MISHAILTVILIPSAFPSLPHSTPSSYTLSNIQHGSSSLLNSADPDPDPEDEEDEEEADNWEVLEALAALLCIIVECNVDPWQTAEVASVEAQVIRMIESQIASYNSLGVNPGLTPNERSQGAADAAQVQSFVSSTPELLEAGLESQYMNALSGMIDDLLSE